MRKAQIILDSLMLIIILSIVFVSTVIIVGESTTKTQGLRYGTQQSQQTVISLLNKYVVLEKDSGDRLAHGRIGDLIAFDYNEAGTSVNSKLVEEINNSLRLINNNKHYIFLTKNTTPISSITAAGDVSFIYVYDNKSTVCLDDISLARYEYKGSKVSFLVLYGTWFKWLDPPETC